MLKLKKKSITKNNSKKIAIKRMEIKFIKTKKQIGEWVIFY